MSDLHRRTLADIDRCAGILRSMRRSDPMQTVEQCAALATAVEWLTRSAVAEARGDSFATWDLIGKAFGSSRQAAQQRFSAYDDRPLPGLDTIAHDVAHLAAGEVARRKKRAKP